MSYPKVVINLEHIRHNANLLLELCHKNQLSMTSVTKVFCGDPTIVKVLEEIGTDYIGDTRIPNLKKNASSTIPKVLLRLPMVSEVYDAVAYSDMCLCSELITIQHLNEAAAKVHKNYGIILMCELGDLREGIEFVDELEHLIEVIEKLDSVYLKGIGTNLTCYGGVIPTVDKLNELVGLQVRIKEKYNLDLEIVSGGNSSSIYLMQQGKIPASINNLRIGEGLVLGRETAYGNQIPGTYDDCFILQAEIIELKEKNSRPTGEIGMNAFGEEPVFQDKGRRLRAILATGRQDVSLEHLIPLDALVTLVGNSSDHLIVDLTETEKHYRVGDVLSFKLTYGGILSTCTSEYVHKDYMWGQIEG